MIIMNAYLSINELVSKAISLRMIHPEDEIYARNQIMALLGLTDFSNENEQKEMRNLDVPELLDELVFFAVQKGLIEDLFDAKEILSSHIMNVFLQIYHQKLIKTSIENGSKVQKKLLPTFMN